MSVLIVGRDSSLTRALVARLREQDDEVRAIHAPDVDAAGLETLGAHIARGAYLDADLIERAGQNCRTVVVIEQSAEVISEIVGGMRAAAIPRVIVVEPPRGIPEVLGELEYVTLARGKRLLRRVVADDDVAEAIDAADDMGGHPQLELDLSSDGAWDELRLARR